VKKKKKKHIRKPERIRGPGVVEKGTTQTASTGGE